MHSLSFRLLVVNELNLQDAVRSGRPSWHPPGAVEDSECQPLWKSKPHSSYPQELGLILLSGQPATIKSLRLTVELARVPAQIVISTALPARQGFATASNPLDAISRYLSVDWKPCCEPLVWEECSSARLDTTREIDSRIVRLDKSECSFLKLVVHAPRKSPRNEFQQVVIEDIELLGLDRSQGTFDGDHEQTNHRFDRVHRPVLYPPTNEKDELQTALLYAGVPMDLVAQVTAIYDEGEILSGSPQKEIKRTLANASDVAPESSFEDSESVTLVHQESKSKPKKVREPISPFDNILRQFVEQTAREKAVLEEILATRICKHTDEVSSWQSPTISPTDPANSNEITLYTFGTFFTQCLLCGGSDIQVTCIQLAERAALLLRSAIGTTSAFEGLVALIVIGVREAKSFQTFQAAIHLAHTIFLVDPSCVEPTLLQSELVKSERHNTLDCGGVASTSTPTLRLVEELAQPNWSFGLRTILEWSLASPLCWSVSHSGKHANPRSIKVLGRSAKVAPSIDRGFLQFIRLLVEQELTCTSFFAELLDQTPTRNPAGITFARNRLRLIRLVLRKEIVRCQISTNVNASIHSLCTNLLSPLNVSRGGQLELECGDRDPVMVRLASECLAEIDRSPSRNQSNSLLTSVRKHLEASNNPNSHHSHRDYHKAFFARDPLSDVEVAQFAAQLQRYFSSQARPDALYRHSFVRGDQSVSKDGGTATHESFQKGNIAFQGQVVVRTPPKGNFHDEIQRKTAPFVFGMGTLRDKKLSASSHLVEHQEIVSTFSAFRGTIEQRSDAPTRSSKVSPAVQQPAQSTSKAATTAANKQSVTPVVSSAVKYLPSDTLAVKKSPTVQDANSAPTPVIVTTSPEVPVAIPIVINSPASPSLAPVADQTPQRPEDSPQLDSTNPSNRHKSDVKTKGKGKAKAEGKSEGKEPDNCVLQ